MGATKPRKPEPDKRIAVYRRQFAIIVICDGEAAQKRVYEGLKAVAGASLKVVAT